MQTIIAYGITALIGAGIGWLSGYWTAVRQARDDSTGDEAATAGSAAATPAPHVRYGVTDGGDVFLCIPKHEVAAKIVAGNLVPAVDDGRGWRALTADERAEIGLPPSRTSADR